MGGTFLIDHHMVALPPHPPASEEPVVAPPGPDTTTGGEDTTTGGEDTTTGSAAP
jgi:hypothetical protein